MLSSGVESLLDSSASAVTEELYTGQPESISTDLMAVSEPNVGLDAKSDLSTPMLTHGDSLSAEHCRTSGAENFCQKTGGLGDAFKAISREPAESLTDALVTAGDLEVDGKNKETNLRKLDYSRDGYQKEYEEAEYVEEYHAECHALTPGESQSKQEDPHLIHHEAKSLRTCWAETAGSLKNAGAYFSCTALSAPAALSEEKQANVQVTAETLPKLTEEVQGMKADGTRIFSKAGYRNGRVSKGLPPESNECPDVDTNMDRAGVSETSMLDFLEPLKVMDLESATEHPQETNEYSGLKAHTAMPLRTGGDIVSVLETREEKLPRRSPVNEFSTSLANCQTYQQDEENNAHDFCTGPVPKHNETHSLSSVESCRALSTKSSEVLYSVLKSISYLDFRNMPLENNSTAVHGILNETPKKYLPQNIKSQTHCDHGTVFVENQTSTSVPAEQILVVRSKELSSAETDHKELSASVGRSYGSEFEEAAEVWRKIAGDNVEVCSWPEAQEGASSKHCHSSVFSSVASSPEEFSKEKFKTVQSEGDKLIKDKWQFSVGDLHKDDVKENSPLMETSNIASHEIGQTDMCFYNTSSKTSPLSSHSCLDLSTKLEYSPEAQLLEKDSKSNTTSEELAGSLAEATEANSNDCLSTDKKNNLLYTLNVTLPPVAQKSRELHCNECPPCNANEVSSRDKAQDNLSGKESFGASGTIGEQVTEIVFHKDKYKSPVSSRTFYNSNMTSKIFQKNMKSSAGNIESVFTGLENEHSDRWNCNNQTIQDTCTAASTSCILSGSTRVDEVLLSSHSFNVEVAKKIEENDNLEGEASAGYNSNKAIIFPEAHFPLACGSLPCEDDWGNRRVDLHGINDISIAQNMFCLAYTAKKSIATLVRDDISNKNMKVLKQRDLCKVTDVSEIVCDRDEGKDQISMCALQTNESDKTITADSPKAPEGHQRNKTSEQLLVRYLNKKPCVHNFGFCNSPLDPKKRELGTREKKEVSSLTGSPSECSASIHDTCLLLSNMNIETQHASQTDNTLCPMENQCLACQSEFDGPVSDRKQHLESLKNHPNSGLQTTATSVEETKIPIWSSPSEEVLLKTGDSLPLLLHKYARENSFQRTLKENVVDLDSLIAVRNEDCSGYVGFITDLTEEKTIKLLEHENGSEREDKGTLQESFPDSKSHCSQHACFIKCAKEKPEPVFAGNKIKQSLPKMKRLVEDQENTVSTQFLPSSSIHESLSHKPENRNVLSETENKRSLRIKSILNNSCLELTLEPGKETNPQKGISPSHFLKFDIQESFHETQVDSETPSPLNLGISLPQKEKLRGSSESTQVDHCDLSSAKVFNRDSSVTKAVSVTVSVKRKGSNTEIPSSENEVATNFLNGAKSSRICARSKESLRNEGHSMLTVKDMDVTSQKGTHCGEKFKSTRVEKKMGREVAPRKKLLIDSFCDGEGRLGSLLEDSKESGSKIVPLSTENCGKVLEEIPISNLSNLSKERKNDTKLTNVAGTSLLLETAHDCQAEDASAETSPDLQYNTTPPFYPHVLSNSCKESSQNCAVCSEVCVPYKLNAQSKDDVKEVTEGQDTIPIHPVCKGNETLCSEALNQVEKRQVRKRQRKHKKMEVYLSDKAQQEQKSEYQEKAKITLQPSMLHSSDLLCSSSNELVTSRNKKFEGPSEDIFAVRTSENKLCSTLQEVKRPKITTDIISSQFLKTQDSEMENLNLNLGYDGIPGAFGTTDKLRGPLPLKIQPGRTCKKVPTSYQLKTVRKNKKIKSSPFFEIPPEVLPKQENTLLKSLYSPSKPPAVETETAMRCVHVPRQKAKRCSLLNSLKFRKCTKEPALLSKLSAMASKLLAPAKSIHNTEPLPYSSEILPVGERYSQRRSKNLLEAFSCINRNLHSRWADSWCTKMFSFQPLALYPVESTKIIFSDLSHKPPTSFLDTPVFPISFHIKLDSGPVTDLTRITAQHSVQHRPVLGEMAAPPSKWTFSFLLSQSSSDRTAFKDNSSLNDELHSSLSVTTPRAAALHPDHGRNAVSQRRGGYSMLGLHTVLALSSPGCYRIWTRRRNLTSHIPTIQRLFISQFAQGLKGARYPTPVSDDLVSSLPYSLGRVLSIWSQHGPSACPSEITPLHSNHCKWQPSVGIENSYALLPHLPVQSMEALQTAGHEICLETSFPLPLPKSCSLPELLTCPPRVSASELQVHALDEADASLPACLRSQADTELKKTEPEKRPNKVSQIRIRKTVPKPDPNLTPMGLPKPKRLKKKEFSLEEIYTNKNYRSPPPARSLETIFEEPKEKNGRLISVSQQKRKRILEFQDFTLPRKRKTRGKIKAVGSFTRAKKAALQSAELDALLSQKLVDLEAFFAKEAEQEQASSI